MDTAHHVRDAVARVTALRAEAAARPELARAVSAIKRLQARRFAGTYYDLLESGMYAAAARFFLEELYSERDYADRDAQFARIAGEIEKLFPADVAATAAQLAQLHAMTESLDHDMALQWLADTEGSDALRYVKAWQVVGRAEDRETQLQTVLAIGHEMARLTRLPGLRLMLKMMRGPAAAAGLQSLQRFLEAGFDTFAAMAKRRHGAEQFLGTVHEREERLIKRLFADDPVACETALVKILGQAR